MTTTSAPGASPPLLRSDARTSPLPLIDALARAGVLSPLDRHLAHAVLALDGADPLLALGAALASRAVQLGHVCVDLSRFDFAELARLELDQERLDTASDWPSRERLLAALRASPLCTQLEPGAASVDAATPLVLDARGRLYLQRYARYERTLAAVLRERARRATDVDLSLLRMGIERL